MNSNLIHNILNVLIALSSFGTAVLVALGCVSAATGAVDCSNAAFNPAALAAVAGGLSVLKIVINVVRDGFSGLGKQQPPVK